MNRKLPGLLRWSALALVGIAVAVVIAAVVALSFAARGVISPGQAVLAVCVPFAIAAMIGGMTLSVVWMRSIDEAAREAHKAAWFWGGCGGMSVGGVFVILAGLPQSAGLRLPSLFADRFDPAAWAATGAMAMLLLMLAGYGIVWAWWWLARTRG